MVNNFFILLSAVGGHLGGGAVRLAAADPSRVPRLLLRALLLHQARGQAATSPGAMSALLNRSVYRSVVVSISSLLHYFSEPPCVHVNIDTSTCGK